MTAIALKLFGCIAVVTAAILGYVAAANEPDRGDFEDEELYRAANREWGDKLTICARILLGCVVGAAITGILSA